VSFDDPFSTNTGLDNIQDQKDRLLLVTPREKITKKTKYKDAQDVVVADYVVLDGPEAGSTYEGVNVFNAPLVGTLEKRIGREKPQLLARLGTRENTKGEKPVWVFMAVSEDDVKAARKYLADQAEKAKAEDPFAV